MQYTEEQITRANQTNLVSFLNAQGEQLVKSGREYRWKKHDSVTVSGNRWYRHSQGRGGYPVDFVMEFYNATFPEAVKKLIGEEGEGRNSTCPAPSPDFRLPEKEENNEKIIRYLTENRGIEKNLVEEWISSGDIYEENSNDAKRAAFMQRIKVNQSSQQQAAAKRAQVSSNNASNSSNKGEAPQRQRSLERGRGNER